MFQTTNQYKTWGYMRDWCREIEYIHEHIQPGQCESQVIPNQLSEWENNQLMEPEWIPGKQLDG